MTTNTDPDGVEELPPVDTEFAGGDHPDEVTEDEAARGQAMYLAVDDLDDESNGLPDYGGAL